jgi:hypothetical protein
MLDTTRRQQLEETEFQWCDPKTFPWDRLKNLMNATEDTRQRIEISIEHGKPLPYTRGTFSNVWEHMEPGDSFHVVGENQRKAALTAARRRGVAVTSEQEGNGWRVWLVSRDEHRKPIIEKGVKPNHKSHPRTAAKEFTLGDGPAKYVYASDMAILENELLKTVAKFGRYKRKTNKDSERLKQAIAFIKSVAKHGPEKVANFARVWLTTHTDTHDKRTTKIAV